MAVYDQCGLGAQQAIERLRSVLNRSTSIHDLEPVGGAVLLRSRFYIRRLGDEELEAALKRKDGIVLVRGARQMGKTSLLLRGLQSAQQVPVRQVVVDLQLFDEEELNDARMFYQVLAERFCDALQLRIRPEITWKDNRSGKRNFEIYLQEAVLKGDDRPLIWAMGRSRPPFYVPVWE